jgi:hypothetical protein
MLYHYVPFFPFPLIHSNFHTIHPYFSRLYITPHSTFYVVTGCAKHSGAQVLFHTTFNFYIALNVSHNFYFLTSLLFFYISFTFLHTFYFSTYLLFQVMTFRSEMVLLLMYIGSTSINRVP